MVSGFLQKPEAGSWPGRCGHCCNPSAHCRLRLRASDIKALPIRFGPGIPPTRLFPGLCLGPSSWFMLAFLRFRLAMNLVCRCFPRFFLAATRMYRWLLASAHRLATAVFVPYRAPAVSDPTLPTMSPAQGPLGLLVRQKEILALSPTIL